MKRSGLVIATTCALGMLTGAPLVYGAEHQGESGMQDSAPGGGMQQEGGMRQEGGMMQQQGQMQQEYQRTPDLATAYRTEKLIGLKVKNNRGEDLGQISQLILNQNGQTTHAVLATGGVLGVGQKEYFVPWNRINIRQGQGYANIDVSKDQISSEFSAFEIKEDQSPMKRQEEESGGMEKQPAEGQTGGGMQQ